MALMEDQESNFKHFCRICKKGFMCGRALGGHMRAHGLGDEGGNLDDEDPGSDWEDRENEPTNKRMYALRRNPNRLKSCRACENCGKEFVSWKSFLEHGKCSSGDGEFLESSPESGRDERRGRHQWSKRKRSQRTKVGSFSSKCPSSEEEDIAATCLVMLSNNASVDVTAAADQPQESCASASRDEEERRNPAAAFIAPLPTHSLLDKAKGVAKGMFECKACKKVFNSHQALGGHRASHKKVKGCYAARFDHETNEDDVIMHEDSFLPSNCTLATFPPNRDQNSSKRKSKVHECSVCHRIFSSGQALGGHKRCHWITTNSPETSKMFPPYYRHDQMERIHDMSKWVNKSNPLDLNLPVSLEGDDLPGMRRNPQNLLSFEVSTEINLQSWADAEGEGKNFALPVVENKNNRNDEDNNVSLQNHKEDEADSKLKLAKLSEMKDMNISGSSSPWLQVGIGSTATGVGPEDP